MTRFRTFGVTAAMLTAALALSPPAAAEHCTGPAYDCFDHALSLSTARPTKFTLDTTGATKEAFEPNPCVLTGGTVWARFTAVTDGIARIRQTAHSSAAFGIKAYHADAPSVARLTLQDCDSYYVNSTLAELRFECVAGETYYIQMGLYFAPGRASFELTGCGQKAATVSPGSTVIAKVHDGARVTSPCPGTCDSRLHVATYDVDAYAAIRPGLRDPIGGTTAEFQAEVYASSFGVDVSGGRVGIVLGTGGDRPPPPPPPTCGAGCGPDEIVKWVVSVVQTTKATAESVAQVTYSP